MLPYKYAILGIIPAVLLGGLALGWASDPPDFPDEEYFEKMNRYKSFVDSHTEAEYADCTLDIKAIDNFDRNSTADIDLMCNYYLGGGGGGGGGAIDDEYPGYPTLFDFDRSAIDRHTNWEQEGIESCTMQAYSFLRHQENGPNTISVLINCWWFDDKKRVNVESSLPEFTPEFLANSTQYALLGVVTQINPVPVQYDEEGMQLVFTDVVIAVNEDLKGQYQDALITIRVDGGETDTTIVTHEDAPRFKVGETVFIFVADKNPAYGDNYSVAGGNQGKYNIRDGILAVNQDPFRDIILDELKAIVQATVP